MVNTGGSFCASNEPYYAKVLENIQSHRTEWFEDIFDDEDNWLLVTEPALGIILALCALRRTRGDLDGATDACRLGTRILDAYRSVSSDPFNAECFGEVEKKRCEEMTYKHDTVATRLYQELRLKPKCIPFVRRAIEYELVHNLSWDKQEWAFMVEDGFGFNDPKYSPLTIPKLRDISDKKVWECLMRALRGEDGSKEAEAMMRRCNDCNAIEFQKGTYKSCNCREVFYCSRSCQRSDWSSHKMLCKEYGGHEEAGEQGTSTQ